MNDYSRVPKQGSRPVELNLAQPRPVSPLGSQATEAVKVVFWVQWLVGTGLHLALLSWLSWEHTGEVSAPYQIMGVIAVLGSVPIYAVCRVYSVHKGYLMGLSRLLVGWTVLVGALVFMAFSTKTSEMFSREVILQWIVGGYGLQLAAYLPFHHLVRKTHKKFKSKRRSLIVGTEELAQKLARILQFGLREPLVGLVEAGETAASARSRWVSSKVLGTVGQVRLLIKEHRVSRVYIALPAAMTEQVEGLYMDLLDANVDVVWVPDVANIMLLNHSVRSVGGLPAVHLNESPLTSYPGSALLKTSMDRAFALMGVIALSPVLAALAIAVKMSSPGPVLFRQQRHGWNGNIIEVLKFRSMYVHQDKVVKQAQKHDPRITPVGRFIRRTSLDELPQLFNVLKGDMSLVGPRPHAIAHNDYYSDKVIAYMARHRIKPGITGWAQVNGLRGETETVDKMAKRVEMDLEYISNWSVWLDCKILIKTPLTLLSKNIY